MNIAVTTASGGLGSAIISQLLKEVPKNQVIGLARSPEKAEFLGVEIRKGDYNNLDDLLLSLTGVDVVHYRQ
jgi:NAD(P)H dehydrogenase (quinone)